MVRRIASQVHKQASRLLVQNVIKREPAWFQAVLDHPPLPLPPREPPARQDYDLLPQDQLAARTAPAKHMRPAPRRPLPIHYLEDDVRTQFFKDHPFEAYRPRSLVEDGEVEGESSIRGENWTRLRQRGRNPSPEDAIRFAVNLHEYHNVPITHAYSAAVAQFRALRSEHEMATRIALMEANHFGLEFGPTVTQRTFDEEQKILQSWSKNKQADAMANTARKRWRMIPEKVGEPGSWTKGEEYTRLWQEGVRPSYAPTLAAPVITPAGLETSQAAPSPSTKLAHILPSIQS
ncbi:mitochondrial ribosomal protein S25-domain-containing protein [Irpex rosettiformis]|uniref:Mitochondrial ribosomal protein S25-domain-containing protein n=1 Tax=Irpex rosettiformis TaxID=378272 RepID=A0ACB8UL63_9APHY|nr:mitochondrial ribosomal protein S25-domain-containing protein [Irpex rosettiformis]